MFDIITPMILTWNEVANIRRTIEKLRWARRILVIDSGSTDGTLDILAEYPQVEVIYRQFDSFADQCNFGLAQIHTKWVLSLDADYELSDKLVQELCELEDTPKLAGYYVTFVYCVYGHRLRGTLYPPRIVLCRACDAHYVNEGHGHRVHITGERGQLRGVIYHDDRKPLVRWVAAQERYAQLEVSHLLDSQSGLSGFDRCRKMGWPAPFIAFFYALLVKGCLLDGWPGWYYSLQRVLAEVIIALELIDRRLRRRVK